MRRFPLILKYLAIIGLSLPLVRTVCVADPIYVYKQSDGSIRFTNKTPPSGVNAKVFTAKRDGFSIYKGGGFVTRGLGKLFPEKFRSYIARAAAVHGVDESLVRAVIHAESAYDPKAVSPKGAIGLMQLMPQTARDTGVVDPFDPRDNIDGGTRHLGMLIRKYKGNIIYALAAYNAGADAVEEHGGIPPFTETRNYVQRVLSLRRRYAGLNYGESYRKPT